MVPQQQWSRSKQGVQHRKKQAAEISQLYSKKIRCIKHMDQTDSGCRQSESKEDGDRGSKENGINSTKTSKFVLNWCLKAKHMMTVLQMSAVKMNYGQNTIKWCIFISYYSLKTQTKTESRCSMTMWACLRCRHENVYTSNKILKILILHMQPKQTVWYYNTLILHLFLAMWWILILCICLIYYVISKVINCI